MDSANALELLVAADKLGIAAVATQCCRVIDQCPLERVLEITSQASDVGLDNRAVLDAKVGQSSCIYTWGEMTSQSHDKKVKVAHTRLSRVPELITILGSQGDMSHKPGGRLSLLSARPAVTLATLKRAATSFAAW